jgi:hypothetical protein
LEKNSATAGIKGRYLEFNFFLCGVLETSFVNKKSIRSPYRRAGPAQEMPFLFAGRASNEEWREKEIHPQKATSIAMA